jgi:hypothetical protein
MQTVLCGGCVIAAALVQAEEWTQFRGSDFGRTSESNVGERWVSELVAWKTPLPGRGASSPVVFNNHIFLTAYTGYGIDGKAPGDPAKLVRHLLCIEAEQGSIVWQKAVPAESDKNVFNTWGVGLHGYASSTPAVDKTGVYVFFGETGVLAFNHAGEELWRTNCGPGTHAFGAGNSPILYKNLVIANASVESGDMIALNKADGGEAWRQPGIKQAWNTPVIYRALNGGNELAVTIAGKILAFDPDTGKPLWNCAGIEDYICPQITVQDGIVYAAGGRSGKTVAVRSGGSGDVTESHRVWELAKGSNVSSRVYHDGHLYWAKEQNGILYCANAATGELLYEERLAPAPDRIYASPLLADGRLYCTSREDGIYVVAAKPEFELLAHTKLEGDDSIFNASPVPLPGGSVLLRSDKYLYRLKPAN